MDLNTLYHRTVESWADRVNAVKADQWDDPTPCREWSVRQLTNHVTGEDLWTSPLVNGATIAEVGDRFDGDVLGDDPIRTALTAAGEATRDVARTLPQHGQVHLSWGDESIDEYVRQLAADHLVHGWDLAVATGGDPRLDPALVAEVAAWFAAYEERFRGAGVIGPRASTGVDPHDPQAALLSAFGRDPSWGPTHAGLTRFSAAFGRGDVDAVMALTTDDCVFEATTPAPDGQRHEGAEAVRAVWEELFATTRDASFTEEESMVCGDRAVLRWRFDWTEPDGAPGHVRGVDVLRLRDGKVCEKLSYVKG
ncbi:TIGR03086 family metal-binding protein [Nocardioides sp. GCM10027113]|uniref:TIGR03086 family metal-binding protein n=1 Tax=unclassified Nocardioides TaxID=2615069 RepID=UPI00360E1236